MSRWKLVTVPILPSESRTNVPYVVRKTPQIPTHPCCFYFLSLAKRSIVSVMGCEKKGRSQRIEQSLILCISLSLCIYLSIYLFLSFSLSLSLCIYLSIYLSLLYSSYTLLNLLNTSHFFKKKILSFADF